MSANASEILQRLKDGNLRFASDQPSHGGTSASRRAELAQGQSPHTVILGCSDSRVPAELVFDQGLGDLFVIRVAGNIVAPSLLGSIEFAAEQFGTRLVVVLGHTKCGAVQATVDSFSNPDAPGSENLRSIVERVRPAVEPLINLDPGGDPQRIVAEAVRANVRMSVNQVHHGSEIVERLVASDGLMIVGAEYSLETGVVEFFDPVTG